MEAVTNLVDFLRQCLDEDEQRLNAPRPTFVFASHLADPSAPRAEEIAAGVDLNEPERKHALAGIEADRQLLREYEEREESLADIGSDSYDVGIVQGLEIAIKCRAAAHAGHPDYDERWRP
jgi:hypothetical protein